VALAEVWPFQRQRGHEARPTGKARALRTLCRRVVVGQPARLLPELAFQPDVRVIQAQVPDLERWKPLTGRWTV
jgi:hypothetical protein